MNGVDQEVDGGEAAGEEGAPLPVVVLPGWGGGEQSRALSEA